MADGRPGGVAVVGVGKLGLALCERLRDRGLTVTGTDVRPERRAAAEAAGATWADSATDAVAGARYVITCLPGDAELASVFPELPAAMQAGTVWLEMSTVAPELAGRRDRAAAAYGLRAIDAPVGGNPEAARAGRLLCFAGGDPDDVDAARPILDVVADRVVHVGPAGTGYLVKLLANASWFAQATVMAETLVLAARAGLDPEAARAAIAQSAAGGRVLADDAPAFLRGENLTSFSLARCCDQLANVVELGERTAGGLTVTAAVAAVHRDALAHYGDVDGELLGARWVAERAGVDFG